MARPARKIEVAPVIDPAIDQEKIEGAMLAMREQEQENHAELFDLAMGVGAVQAMELVKTFASAAQIKLFKRIREYKQIKHLPARLPDGSVKTFDSMKEACPAFFGRTYQSMLDAEERYSTFGEEAYEAAARLRLNDSALRAARALPPEKLEVVRLAISNGSTKADVLSVIEDLAEKTEEATKAVEEAKAEIEAKEQLLADKNKTIDKLKAAQKRIQAATPDQELADIKKEATALAADAEGAIVGGLRQALAAINNHGEYGSQQMFMAGLIGQVQAQLNALREEFDLPDTSTAADQQLAAEHAQWSKD